MAETHKCEEIDLIVKNKREREKIIERTSFLGIIMNVVLSLVKIALGLFTKSTAIIAEGINNATDILSSVLTLVGSKLAGFHPDAKHPFGYGRVEYLTSLVISIIILVTGIETLINSIKQIFVPSELSASYSALVVIAISMVVKFVYGTYAIKVGKKHNSSSLEGVGIDSRSDCFLSLITIVSTLVFITFKISIDAYAGIIISILIIKAGLGILMGTTSELLGRAGDAELARNIYKEIQKTPGILNAADMMLHNYGPNQHAGSVNIEIDHEATIGEIYEEIHKLQLRIMHEYGVTMVFGIYAVDNDHEETKIVREVVGEYIKNNKHIKNFHAIYLEPHTNKIYCDLVVDYSLKTWTPLKEDFCKYMKEKFPNNELELTIETEFV